MTSVEASVKAQFAKQFNTHDAPLFKKLAEANLKEAAKLRSVDMPVPTPLRLLARNSRKRLLIGIGVELLLKAAYLKNGYGINAVQRGSNSRFPVKADAAGVQFSLEKTVMLNELIQHLPKVVALADEKTTMRGLVIAKVFRNKEGHSVTSSHAFDSTNYTDIATSLVNIYRDVFGEALYVRFSLAPAELAVWRTQRPKPSFKRTANGEPVSAA
jgi:hypothetical protein